MKTMMNPSFSASEQLVLNLTQKRLNSHNGHSGKPCRKCGIDFKEGDNMIKKKNPSRLHLETFGVKLGR